MQLKMNTQMLWRPWWSRTKMFRATKVLANNKSGWISKLNANKMCILFLPCLQLVTTSREDSECSHLLLTAALLTGSYPGQEKHCRVLLSSSSKMSKTCQKRTVSSLFVLICKWEPPIWLSNIRKMRRDTTMLLQLHIWFWSKLSCSCWKKRENQLVQLSTSTPRVSTNLPMLKFRLIFLKSSLLCSCHNLLRPRKRLRRKLLRSTFRRRKLLSLRQL